MQPRTRTLPVFAYNHKVLALLNERAREHDRVRMFFEIRCIFKIPNPRKVLVQSCRLEGNRSDSIVL